VPFVAKATKIPLAKIATMIMVGKSLKDFKLKYHKPNYFAVKEVVFPFAKFGDVDTLLGPEMKSTGEVMGIDKTFELAFAKAQIAAGVNLPISGTAFLSVKDSDKKHLVQIAKDLSDIGFKIIATKGTAKFLNDANIKTKIVNKVAEGGPHIVDMILNKKVDLIVNTTEGATATKDSFSIRRTALTKNITYGTTIAGAKALTAAIKAYKDKNMDLDVTALQDL
jgi:carbamoyl-phosphate synthase large subunit